MEHGMANAGVPMVLEDVNGYVADGDAHYDV